MPNAYLHNYILLTAFINKKISGRVANVKYGLPCVISDCRDDLCIGSRTCCVDLLIVA